MLNSHASRMMKINSKSKLNSPCQPGQFDDTLVLNDRVDREVFYSWNGPADKCRIVHASKANGDNKPIIIIYLFTLSHN